MSVKVDSYCGLSCEKCQHKIQNECSGCIATEGNSFYGKCKIAECAKKRGKRFCGECEKLPCDTIKKCSFDEEYGDGEKRIENCREQKIALVKEARTGLDPVSICGHHCDYCFMGQWCGGCRSNYNCCSYALLIKDGVCPNVRCAREKGIDGCYECDRLLKCKKGYYGRKKEFAAKTTALFIQKYGKKVYAKALQNAISQGQNYPKSFDEAGSVEEALRLLESFR